MSQVLQAEGIARGTEHLRRIMPHNMGALYWQINDCWPVASWSSIDYFGRWKALQYYAKRFYKDLLISPTEEDGTLKVYVVSDRVKPVAATIMVWIINTDNVMNGTYTEKVEIAPLSSRSYLEIKLSELPKEFDKKHSIAHCELILDREPYATQDFFFAPFKEMKFSKPSITPVITAKGRGRFSIQLKWDKFAKAVYLSVPDHDGVFSDNYFNLSIYRDKIVEYRSRVPMSLEEFRKRLQIRSVFDAF